MTHSTRPERGGSSTRGGRAGALFLALVAGVAGLLAGVRWHGHLGSLFGIESLAHNQGAAAPGSDGEAKQLWTCSMHPQVIRDQPGDCPICHMKLTPLRVEAGHPEIITNPAAAGSGVQSADARPVEPGAADGQARKVKYWWDPMLNPPYISDRPGKSPMGMDLIPVYEEADSGTGAAVVIDPVVVQNMGVRTATVMEGPLRRSIRLVGYLDEAQPNMHEVNLRVSGWIERLHADTEGRHVEAGDPLFDLYSPELQVAIGELIAARRAASAVAAVDRDADTPNATAAFVDAAKRRLELLGLSTAQIDALAKLDSAPRTITFVSPVMGHVTDKPVVQGASVAAGTRVMTIVDHTTLWLDARVFEKDLPLINVGDEVLATIASRPAEPVVGRVVFIHPHVDPATRTVIVRMAIENPSLDLRPGMYATAHVRAEVSDRAVLVPREAIIDTGEKQIVFIAQGSGRFEPRQVVMGHAGDDGVVQVLEGLAAGETVVTSGQFLLDSESRLREAIRKFLRGGQP